MYDKKDNRILLCTLENLNEVYVFGVSKAMSFAHPSGYAYMG